MKEIEKYSVGTIVWYISRYDNKPIRAIIKKVEKIGDDIGFITIAPFNNQSEEIEGVVSSELYRVDYYEDMKNLCTYLEVLQMVLHNDCINIAILNHDLKKEYGF